QAQGEDRDLGHGRASPRGGGHHSRRCPYGPDRRRQDLHHFNRRGRPHPHRRARSRRDLMAIVERWRSHGRRMLEKEDSNMRDFSLTHTRHVLLRATVAVCFASLLSGLAIPLYPAADPHPDPAGIATGDKSTALDAAGNPFVVPEPTDKTDPDYAQKKKAFDEYQDQA